MPLDACEPEDCEPDEVVPVLVDGDAKASCGASPAAAQKNAAVTACRRRIDAPTRSTLIPGCPTCAPTSNHLYEAKILSLPHGVACGNGLSNRMRGYTR